MAERFIQVNGQTLDLARVRDVVENQDSKGKGISFTVVKDAHHDDKDAGANDTQGGHQGNRDTLSVEDGARVRDAWAAYHGKGGEAPLEDKASGAQNITSE